MEKRIVYPTCITTRDLCFEGLRRIARLLGEETHLCADGTGHSFVALPAHFVESSPRYAAFLKALGEMGIEFPPIRVEEVLSSDELRHCDWLVLWTRRLMSRSVRTKIADVDSSTACPDCGSGSTQNSDALIDLKSFGARQIGFTCDDIILVSDELKRAIEAEAMSGVTFRPTHDAVQRRTELRLPGVWQLVVTSVLPALHPETMLIREYYYCERCGKRGLYRRLPCVYDRASLVDASDFNETHEWFGVGRGCGHRSNLVVSNRVWELFARLKIRDLGWEPVILV